MPVYLVTERQIWNQSIRVEAKNEADAIEQAKNSKGEIGHFGFDEVQGYEAMPIGAK